MKGADLYLIHEKSLAERLIANLDPSDRSDFLTLLYPNAERQTLSYSDLLERSGRWAHFYRARGLKRGDRVVIILKHSVDLYASFIGAVLGGFVPAMFAYPSPKFSPEAYFNTIGALLDNAQPGALVVYPELRSQLRETWDESLTVIVPADITDDAAIIPEPAAGIGPEETVFLQYSSGTTGLKKGVAISHQALMWQIAEYSRVIKLSPQDVIVSWLPLYHDMGLISCFMMPIIQQIPIVAMSPFDWVKRPGMLLESISEFKGTICFLPNFAYNFLTNNVRESPTSTFDLSRLRGIVNCSEPIMGESHDLFLSKFSPYGFRPQMFATSYAMAENTFAVTSGGFGVPVVERWIDALVFSKTNQAVEGPAGASGMRRVVSSGRALADTVIEIVGPDGMLLPERVQGEIVLQTPCLLKEYFRNPVDSHSSIRNGKYHTGDFGFLSDGELFVTGRKKDMIIIGGHNIYPQDIEAIVNRTPGVHPGRCVAIGVGNMGAGTESLVVIAETEETDPVRKQEIQSLIFDTVAAETDLVPSDVRLVEHMWLHKSSAGKISRRRNLERYLELQDIEHAEVARPGDDSLDGRVSRVVSRVMSRLPSHRDRRLRVTDKLVSSGLIDSFLMAALIVELEQEFQLRIPDEALAEPDAIDSIQNISRLVRRLRDGEQNLVTGGLMTPRTRDEISMESPSARPSRGRKGFWTRYYRILFRLKGIKFGRGLQVHGRLILRLEKPQNLVIGNDVTLMPMVDLKIRENGRIKIGDGVLLDTMTRLVAANDALLQLGDDVRMAIGTVVNAGTDLLIGHHALIAGFCVINSSEHNLSDMRNIAEQGFSHAPVYIAEETWIGAKVFIEKGSRIGKGAAIGAGAVVTGEIPPFAIALGVPARVVKFRKQDDKAL